MGKAFTEIPGGDAGHAQTGHGLHFVKTECEEFAVGDADRYWDCRDRCHSSVISSGTPLRAGREPPWDAIRKTCDERLWWFPAFVDECRD